jgi:hypothetical protein
MGCFNLYSSSQIKEVEVEHVTHIGEMRNANKIPDSRPEDKIIWDAEVYDFVYNMNVFFNSQYVTNAMNIHFILVMSHKKIVDFSRI